MKKSSGNKPWHDYSNLLKYPEPAEDKSGCKVCWRYYKTEAEAKECSKVAIHNAKIDSYHGYDYGYCSPGSIKETDDGLFEVCCPFA